MPAVHTIVAIASLIAGASALRAPTPASRSRIEAPRTTLDRRAVVAVVASMFAAAPAFAEYTVPDLPYPYEALEPHIDAATMRFHHDKHHGACARSRTPSLCDARVATARARANRAPNLAGLTRHVARVGRRSRALPQPPTWPT